MVINGRKGLKQINKKILFLRLINKENIESIGQHLANALSLMISRLSAASGRFG